MGIGKDYGMDIELEIMNILSKEVSDSIDKEILNQLIKLGISKELLEKTISNIRQSIRSDRLEKLLNKNNTDNDRL